MKKTIQVVFLALTIYSCGSQGQDSDQSSDNSVASPEVGLEVEDPIINVSGQEAIKLVEDSTVTVIDVRTPDEVKQGYIEGTDLFYNLYGDFDTEIDSLDKTQKYLVYCASGVRSGEAAQKMKADSFEHIYNLLGGIDNYSGPITQ